MTHKSHYDPAKEKWREAWYHFIRKHRHSLRGSPQDWQVVFFPGEEALELDVYDRLKIPRENLLGLERNRAFHEKLRKKKLGIRLTDEPMDAVDFFRKTDEKFEIGSLDYEGPLARQVVKTLRYLAGRQILNEGAIFGITTYNKRESQDVKKFYQRTIAAREFYRLVNRGEMEPLRGKYQSPKEFIGNFGHTQEPMIKHLGHSDAICGIFLSGTENVEINPIFLRNPRFRYIDETIDDASIMEIPGLDRTIVHANDALNIVHSNALSQHLLAAGLGENPVSLQNY